MKAFLAVALLLAAFPSLLFAAPPVITDVQITRQSERRSAHLVFYSQTIEITVSDAEGWANVASVRIEFPDGSAYTATASDPMGWSQKDAQTVTVTYDPEGGVPAALDPPPAGDYVITAADLDADSDTLTAQTPGSVPACGGMLPADTSVITDTVPLFQWSFGGHVPATQSLTVWESGDQPSGSRAPLWSVTPAAAATQILFDNDGTALHHSLLPGREYLWQVAAEIVEDDYVTHPKVRVTTSATASERFALPETRPDNPAIYGELVFTTNPGNLTEIRSSQFFETESDYPSWFGPVGAVYADWSPDGTKLIYSQEPQRYLWVDALDGSPPTCLGLTGFDARYSPDGTKIVYSRYRTDTPQFNLWIADADGSNEHILLSQPDVYQRYCHWSPDGEWIAYRASGQASWLWLIRPDGSDNHALNFTGVEGYPGYNVCCAPELDWSPDGQRLVVVFNAGDSSGGYIRGLGVVSRDGGLLKPIFLSPAGMVCCADVHLPAWSPDGTQVLFSSAFQVTPDPNWGTQGLVSNVELWVLNADGSGAPTQLTHNRVFDGYVSWWGPNVFSDVPKGSWAYGAIGTCHKSDIVAGYPDGAYGPTLPVSRDQMAVYISRALAPGDANVPAGPSTPSFIDVPLDYWAFKYVEYAKLREVALGYPDGLYRPDEVLNRAQMAVYLARALNGSEALVPPGPPTASFPDVPTDYWAYNHIEDIKARGVTGGYEDGNYHPDDPCTRDQMAMFVARAFALPM